MVCAGEKCHVTGLRYEGGGQMSGTEHKEHKGGRETAAVTSGDRNNEPLCRRDEKVGEKEKCLTSTQTVVDTLMDHILLFCF